MERPGDVAQPESAEAPEARRGGHPAGAGPDARLAKAPAPVAMSEQANPAWLGCALLSVAFGMGGVVGFVVGRCW